MCCGISGVMTMIELVEGKDRPHELSYPKFDDHVVPTKSITQVPASPFLGILRFLIPLNAYLLLFV